MKTLLSIFLFFHIILIQDIHASSSRVVKASLWVEDLKIPVTHGHVIIMDSIFSLFIPLRNLTLDDIHSQAVVQMPGYGAGTTYLGHIVDYDITHSWMLVELRKQEIVAPKQKLSESQVIDLVKKAGLIAPRQEQAFTATLKKFEKNTHSRGLAGRRLFQEVVEEQMQNFGDKFSNTLLRSQRRMNWSQNISSYLPAVDSCRMDTQVMKSVKNKSHLRITKAFNCKATMGLERELASAALAPEFNVATGIMNTSEPYLRVNTVSSQMREISDLLDSRELNHSSQPEKCIEYWISERNIFSKSCIRKNDLFSKLYDGYHLIGFYQNQKIVYQAYHLKAFSKQSHQNIIDKIIKETKGSVL